MSTRSRAEPVSPDVSLAREAGPETHRGLTYVLGRAGPESGAMREVAPGLLWGRLPVPGALRHINVWAHEDGVGDDLALIDTGLDIPPSREGWETMFAGALAGKRVARIVCTHFHPDHIGLAGWLARRFAAPLFMTRGEWLFARMLTADIRDEPPVEAIAYWRGAGWEEKRIAAETTRGWGRFASVVSPVPVSYARLRDGDVLRLGARDWRVVTGSGHSPEHACLVCEADGLMIAGDQVLPRITSNVSLSLSEPQADPLGEWLASIEKLKGLPADLLVLPSHGEPFTGLHERLHALAQGHRGRLDALHEKLAEPRRAVDVFTTLFGRKVSDNVYGLATGEALAHLRHLEITGRAERETRDGVWWFRAL